MIKTAKTSVPSITDPPRIANPIPKPKKKPPNKATSNLSLEITGKGIKWTDRASNEIAKMLLNANCQLIVEKAKRRNGRLISAISIESGNPDSSVTISEIPVTPPSIKEFGSKKPFNPKVAEMTPKIINMVSSKKCRNDVLISSISLCVNLLLLICLPLTASIISCWNIGFITFFYLK